jgi:hypothetical protein
LGQVWKDDKFRCYDCGNRELKGEHSNGL